MPGTRQKKDILENITDLTDICGRAMHEFLEPSRTHKYTKIQPSGFFCFGQFDLGALLKLYVTNFLYLVCKDIAFVCQTFLSR